MTSGESQTAADYINEQLRLEADAKEALPYSFDQCTRSLGPLRQYLFSCLTCNPLPSDPSGPYNPAGVCYACSISCHGEHELVELFTKRNFVCDCGTTRISNGAECRLRYPPRSVVKGVKNEQPAEQNKYNPNYRNIFCGCQKPYESEQEKRTMFQCLGLGSIENGGCGEDWWHPECLVGAEKDWAKSSDKENEQPTHEDDERKAKGHPQPEDSEGDGETQMEEDVPLPPGFPHEDDFETFICYKCVDANPWLKQYAGTPGFLPPVYKQDHSPELEETPLSRKRKLQDDSEDHRAPKQPRSGSPHIGNQQILQKPEQRDEEKTPLPKHASLPQPAPSGTFSLFVKEDFREYFCRCASCFPHLAPHKQLLEEEDTYEPPLSVSGDENNDNSDNASIDTATRTGSLYERGQAALNNMDRVHAIEGVMAYQHVRDKVKDFLKPYAESGEVVSAEDIKSYFAKLRGDDTTRRLDGPSEQDGEGGGDQRREQSGY